MNRISGYKKDLAFIHDRGFSSFSLEAAEGLLKLFRKHRIPEARVVELGCGSGRLAHVPVSDGFNVTGIDSSPSMIALARQNAPRGKFSVRCIWNYDVPRCGGVISIGEVLNYQFAGWISRRRLRVLFSRIYKSLVPSGLFVFDILCTRDEGRTVHTRSFTESRNWLVAVDKSDSPTSIVRRIVSFRKQGRRYRRSVEVHTVQRYNLQEVLAAMRGIGFSVSTRGGYLRRPLGNGHFVVVGRKPAGSSLR